MTTQKWHYRSENLPGNLHAAAGYINAHHPEWDVVAMDYNGGGYTVVVYRESYQNDQAVWSPCEVCGVQKFEHGDEHAYQGKCLSDPVRRRTR